MHTSIPNLTRGHVVKTAEFTFKQLMNFCITLLAFCTAIQNAWPNIQTSIELDILRKTDANAIHPCKCIFPIEEIQVQLDNSALYESKMQTGPNLQTASIETYGKDELKYMNPLDTDGIMYDEAIEKKPVKLELSNNPELTDEK